MQCIDDLYVGASVSDLGTVLYSLRRNIPMIRVYCIVWFANKNRMVLLSSKELFSGRYDKQNPIIAGVAMGKQESIDVLCYMLEETVKAKRDITNPKMWIL